MWALGVECFQPPLGISVGLCIFSSCFSTPGSVHVSIKTWEMLFHASNSGYSLLDGESLASNSSQHFGGHYLSMSYHKSLVVEGSAIAAFNPSAHVLHRQKLYSTVGQAMAGMMQASAAKVYEQCWKGWHVGVLEAVLNSVTSASKLAELFLAHLLMLDWLGIQLVFTVVLFQLFWNVNLITRLQIIL